MKKIIVFFIISGFFVIFGFAQQQQETLTPIQIVEKIGERISQIPDGQVIKNVSGKMVFEIKLNETDYKNFKDLSEKLTGKTPTNPLRLEGNFVSVLKMPGGKIEKFFFSGSSYLGSVYIYRNLDDIVCMLPDIRIQIEDRLSEIKKLSSNQPARLPENTFMSELSNLMVSNSLKTLFSMGKVWFYDSEISRIEKTGRKFVKMKKMEDEKGIEMTVDTMTYLFTEILLKDKQAQISMKFGVPEDIKKINLTDYMPQSIIIDTTDKGNIIKIELDSLVYNKNLSDDIFYLKKMKVSEFISSMALKLLNQ